LANPSLSPSLSHTHSTEIVDAAKLSPPALTAENTDEGELEGGGMGKKGGEMKKRKKSQTKLEGGRKTCGWKGGLRGRVISHRAGMRRCQRRNEGDKNTESVGEGRKGEEANVCSKRKEKWKEGKT